MLSTYHINKYIPIYVSLYVYLCMLSTYHTNKYITIYVSLYVYLHMFSTYLFITQRCTIFFRVLYFYVSPAELIYGVSIVLGMKGN